MVSPDTTKAPGRPRIGFAPHSGLNTVREQQFGKCPGCAATLERVKAQPVTIEIDETSRNAAGVSLFCTPCGYLLSVQIDPYAMDRKAAGVAWYSGGTRGRRPSQS